MKTLEQEGKTVDDAISKALEELHVSRDQISVEILEEGSRGLFGLMGARPAKIRVNVAQDASYDAIKEELRSGQPAESQEKNTQKKDAENKDSRPKKQQASRGKKRPSQQRAAGEGQKERSKEQAKERSKERVEDSALQEYTTESPKKIDEKTIEQITEKAKEALGVILANLQVEYKVEVKRRDDQILMNIHCDNENFLIGRRGTTLDAVQYLVNRIANKDLEEKIQVVLDTSDYRTNRRQRLEKLALRLSRRVKTTGKSVTVAPMNPHDRRIIHLTLQDDSSIRTLSRGTGFMRRIIISSNRSSKQRKSSSSSE